MANKSKKQNKYFTKGGYFKIKRMLQERSRNAEKWLRGHKRPLLAIGAATLTFSGIRLAHKTELDGLNPPNISDNAQYHMDIDLEGNYVVTYINTNAYSEVPEYNKIERLIPSDIIEFQPAFVGHYVESTEDADYWELDSTNSDSNATRWNFCVNRNTGNTGYVPDEYVTRYCPFQVVEGSAKYKSALDDVQFEGEIEEGEYVYANEGQMYHDIDGNSIFQVIIRNSHEVLEDETGKVRTEYEYKTGYMNIDNLVMAKNKDNIGVINQSTYLREFPIVTELQNDIVKGLLQNGQRLNVLDKVEEGPETWYRCRIPGGSEVFYVASYAVKNVHEYNMQIEYSGDKIGHIIKPGNEKNKYIYQGDKVYIDLKSRNGDIVPIMVDGCTGYMDLKNLGLDYLSEDLVTSKETSANSKTGENSINIRNSNTFENNVTVSNNENTKNTENIGDNKYNTNKSNEKNSVQYIIDLCDFTHYDDFLNKISELKSVGKLGGVILEIGGTKLNEKFTKKIIADRESDTREYINNQNSGVALQKYYDEINSHFIANQRGNDTVMGNWDDFIKHVKTAVDNEIPVGFYYYSCAVNANEASAEAAYINSIYQKIYSEIPEFKKSKQLPITIDIEDAGEYRNELKAERTSAAAEIVKLLGEGTSNKFCWRTDGKEANEGYGVIDNQYMLYAGATATVDKAEQSNLGAYINSLESLQNMTSDYNMIKFYACALCVDVDYHSDEVQHNLIGPNLVDRMKNNQYFAGNKGFSTSSIKAADLVQCMLNVDFDAWRNQDSTILPIDITATDKETIDEILKGTYTHKKDFIEKLDNAAKENQQHKAIAYESEYSTGIYETTVPEDGYQSYDLEIE